jgi:putative nucleotidyltransferase with HDIG domain
MVLLFIFPLLLARYSFNLYLDSKNQYYKMVKTLVVTLEAKDIYTKGHSQRVEAYAEEICMAMRMPMAQTEIIKIAALLHDIGKIGIGDTILGKPGRLTDDEFMVITTHPAIGVKILKEINVNPKIVQYVKYHHKWFNGCGYPDVDDGEEVPLESFILGVADAYDAMTSDRPYRKGFSPEKALQIIEESMGEQFHPEVAKVFLKIKRAQLERGEPVTELQKEEEQELVC